MSYLRRDRITPGNVRRDAIAGIYRELDSDLCHACKSRIFRECQDKLPNDEAR